MRIVFYSNFLNHHQLPLCNSFLKSDEIEFYFIASTPLPEEKIKVGYDDYNSLPFVLNTYTDDEHTAFAMKALYDADIAIIGAADASIVKYRLKTGKLTFRYCERLLKRGEWRRFVPHTRLRIIREYTQYKKAPLYILGASSCTAHDLVKCGFPIDKCLTWGYFPELSMNSQEIITKKKQSDTFEIIYAGRLLQLKNVMHAVKSVHSVYLKGYNVHFTIIGEGETKAEIEQYVKDHQLHNVIALHTFMNHKDLIDVFERSDAFVFCSNRYEGWGAVINEAMSSMCVVISSDAVGSSKTLIQHNINGLLYHFGDIEDLSSQIIRLVTDDQLRVKLRNNAYASVNTTWSAETAAKRLISVSKAIIDQKEWKSMYRDGPCSKAIDFDKV